MDDVKARWLEANHFLEPLARFHGAIQAAAAGIAAPATTAVALDAHAADFAAGVPLLGGTSCGPSLAAAGADALAVLAARLDPASLPGPVAQALAELRPVLASPDGRIAAMAWLLGGEAPAPAHPGLVRFLGWTAMQRVLEPVTAPFTAWRVDHAWGRPTCPTCGQLPVMSQLSGGDGMRDRTLACGLCATRWSYRRTGCPYCGNEAAERLGVLELEAEAGLRLDTCESCKGYLKTYTGGPADEPFFLSDWPTLLLDAAAAERGWVRRGASLFDL